MFGVPSVRRLRADVGVWVCLRSQQSVKDLQTGCNVLVSSM